jgi:glycosyltransferase involved in cell wall biosynthesis
MESAAASPVPKISVIMPAYNTAHLIAGALDSVLQQTFRDFEILVVNDGSPDTAELERVLLPYRDRIVYIQQPNKRAAGARNTAIGRARGEFMAFLDSDDTWLPDHLASQMTLFEQDPTLDLVYSDCVLQTGTGSRQFMDICPSHGLATFEALIVERCQIPVSTVVARKPALAKAGFFDESLARCDDYDMWVRAAFWGARIGYSRNVQARLSGGRPGALSASRIKMIAAYLEILDKAHRSLPLSDKQRDLIQKRTAEARARYLVEQGKLQLHEGKLREAKKSFSEANENARRPKISLLLLGLKVAPRTTAKLLSLTKKTRNSRSVDTPE